MSESKDRNHYPINLLRTLDSKHAWEIPDPLTADSSAGLNYALSTLTDTAQAWVRLRFQLGYSAREAAEALCLSADAEKRLEADTLKKLRATFRWDYIRYGIRGNLRRLSDQARAAGYLEGYRKGLEDGGKESASAGPDRELLERPISVLPLPAMARNALTRHGLETLSDLAALDEYDIMKIRSLGVRGANSVAHALADAEITGTEWEKYFIPDPSEKDPESHPCGG